ncbi:glycosyltransferase family 4 protein [Leptospirillum ferriphilum]|uniref:Glycosyltransferase involved in cell wall bisynthesis n=1 Tax=Leptospirillum ferriphilum TaxID=178606 RepID=A0A2I2MHJ9_9BACT|nr:glycosyltransferase family 4 protein [Leptospirillum ferriphilum]
METKNDGNACKDRQGLLKIAIVHEWLVTWAGSERVLAEIMTLYPEADLYVLFDRLPADKRSALPRNPVGESFLGKWPKIDRSYRNLLPLMPAAVESLNLKDYDLVLTSSHAVVKGLLLHSGQLHLCYCHTPPRYLWDMTETYFSRSFSGRLKRAAASLFLSRLRQWDYRAGQRPDAFIANSDFVARRISRIYGRTSIVIHPPVDIERFAVKPGPGGEYFVTLGRFVPYKNIDRIVQAFRSLPYELVIVGDGPGRNRIEDLLRGQRNIRWLPYITDQEWGDLLQKARAFLFMAEEDFGIAPLEAQAAGVPVIAWGAGGILETVPGLKTEDVNRSGISGPVGVLYADPTPDALSQAVHFFVEREEMFQPEAARKNAGRFSRALFRTRYQSFVADQVRQMFGDRPIPGSSGLSERPDHAC